MSSIFRFKGCSPKRRNHSDRRSTQHIKNLSENILESHIDHLRLSGKRQHSEERHLLIFGSPKTTNKDLKMITPRTQAETKQIQTSENKKKKLHFDFLKEKMSKTERFIIQNLDKQVAENDFAKASLKINEK